MPGGRRECRRCTWAMQDPIAGTDRPCAARCCSTKRRNPQLRRGGTGGPVGTAEKTPGNAAVPIHSAPTQRQQSRQGLDRDQDFFVVDDLCAAPTGEGPAGAHWSGWYASGPQQLELATPRQGDDADHPSEALTTLPTTSSQHYIVTERN
jgi:hypothetical protein